MMVARLVSGDARFGRADSVRPQRPILRGLQFFIDPSPAEVRLVWVAVAIPGRPIFTG